MQKHTNPFFFYFYKSDHIKEFKTYDNHVQQFTYSLTINIMLLNTVGQPFLKLPIQKI